MNLFLYYHRLAPITDLYIGQWLLWTVCTAIFVESGEGPAGFGTALHVGDINKVK